MLLVIWYLSMSLFTLLMWLSPTINNLLLMLVKNKPHKCELFSVHHFIHKMCWIGGWPPKISVLLSWIIFPQIDVGNLQTGWLQLNIFIPRFWVLIAADKAGGWHNQWSLSPQNGHIWIKFTKIFFGILQTNNNCLLWVPF